MKKITFAILGMGNRGHAYASKQRKYPEEMQVVAIADTRRERLDSANKYLNIPQERIFDSADAILAQPKLSDVMIIATQDCQHLEHAMKAMELGYDLVLEKPISNKLEDIVVIAEAAKRLAQEKAEEAGETEEKAKKPAAKKPAARKPAAKKAAAPKAEAAEAKAE